MSGHSHTRWRNGGGPWSPCPPDCPAAPVVQGADELREAIEATTEHRSDAALLLLRAATGRGTADAVEAVARLLAERDQAQAKVAAVRAEVDAWADAASEWYYAHRYDDAGTTYACGFEDGWNHAAVIRRALDGTT